jgi:hypothetical protein
MWQMIGVLAELERSLISERTRAGVKAAQRRGVKFGRKAKLTSERIDHARGLIDKGEARQYVAGLLNSGPLDALPCDELLSGAMRPLPDIPDSILGLDGSPLGAGKRLL